MRSCTINIFRRQGIYITIHQVIHCFLHHQISLLQYPSDSRIPSNFSDYNLSSTINQPSPLPPMACEIRCWQLPCRHSEPKDIKCSLAGNPSPPPHSLFIPPLYTQPNSQQATSTTLYPSHPPLHLRSQLAPSAIPQHPSQNANGQTSHSNWLIANYRLPGRSIAFIEAWMMVCPLRKRVLGRWSIGLYHGLRHRRRAMDIILDQMDKNIGLRSLLKLVSASSGSTSIR